MSVLKNRIVRDAVHELIEVDDGIRAIVDTPEFQRLRAIRQTGLAYLVFPGAEHSRFQHALGAYAVAVRFYRHLRSIASDGFGAVPPRAFTDDLGKEFAVAALLHDLGHTAFSHALENTFLATGSSNHEEAGRAILMRDNSRIRRAIDDYCDLESVIGLLSKDHDFPALCDLISCDYDVDRCDFLLRDTHFVGVDYGRYDLTWLIHTISLRLNDEKLPKLVLDGKRGLDSFRQHAQARRFMYRHVYHHPTVRAAERLLRAIIERTLDVRDRVDQKLIPLALVNPLFTGNQPSIEDFLRVTDAAVLSLVDNLAHGVEDPLLRYLAQSFLHRKLPKTVFDSTSIEWIKSPMSEGDEYLTSHIAEIRKIVAHECRGQIDGLDDGVQYLVYEDEFKISGVNVEDVYFSFGSRNLNLAELFGEFGDQFSFGPLKEDVRAKRLYVPREARSAVLSYLRDQIQ